MKTDLFRFATLRTPQLISEDIKKIGYLNHPNQAQSFFLKAIKNIKDLDKARKKIKDIFAGFNASNEVKAQNWPLHRFSSWLMTNKHTLTLAAVNEKANDVEALTKEKQIFLWDNLLYQIASKQSSYVRQQCIQMLIASNFIVKTKDIDEIKKEAKAITTPRLPLPPEEDWQIDLYLRKLANAKIVIPKAFSVKKEDKGKEKYKPKMSYTVVENNFKKAYAVQKVSHLEKIQTELKFHDTTYKYDYSKSYNDAEIKHDTKVGKIKKEFLDKVNLGKPATDLKTRKAASELAKELKADIKYPKFEFNFTKPLNDKYIKGKLSLQAMKLVKDLKLHDASVEHAMSKVNHEIEKQNKIANGVLKGNRKILVANGNVIKIGDKGLYCFTIGISHGERIKDLNGIVYMAINVGYKNAFVVDSKFSLKIENKVHRSDKVDFISNFGSTVFIRLFPDKKDFVKNSQIFDISGEMRFNNGIRLKIEAQGFSKNRYTSGSAEIVRGNVVQEEKDIHFGVNRIGVADYRKVEQEVCCYVPGEVSHIENILAKEYKERHTRHLTSSETTSEVTSELEMENLTDTSTTERNEMNTETSVVLNEDSSSNFGFSAGVSATYMGVTVNANAYADFASSNSSSNSNSVAKTYAEDITRRALERVVQKMSEKRTSKILKEYEENNRHGFDNRNGDKHVTGIYRWVDKIYTNRLINYGKRLMYEFLIPEPARFYKTAIETQLEDGQDTSEVTNIIEEPVSPEELGFSQPSDITEDNFRTFAAAYNVNIAAPIPATDEKSYSTAPVPMPNNDDFSFTIESLLVPDFYETVKAETYITFQYDEDFWGRDGYFKLVIGGMSFSKKKEGDGNYGVRRTFTFSSPINTKVSGSMNGTRIVSANVDITLKLDRMPGVFEDWQYKAYNTLMIAYQTKLDEFNAEKDAAGLNETSESESARTNPRFNRITEQREIKRICIEMLARPFDIPIGRNLYRTVTPCGDENPTEIHIVKQNASFDKYASHVKFFEQAFDWEIISYLFYPYYWADKCKWIELFQAKDASDPIFQAFLQSGMARVVVPVRVGFEEAVSYFMETGDIWNGNGLVLDSENDLYLSIVEEMQEIEGKVEEEWQTTVPTSLTIVQNKSAELDEGGLPCCDDVDDGDSIKESEVTISLPDPVN